VTTKYDKSTLASYGGYIEGKGPMLPFFWPLSEERCEKDQKAMRTRDRPSNLCPNLGEAGRGRDDRFHGELKSIVHF
jgi:hypothetical protein